MHEEEDLLGRLHRWWQRTSRVLHDQSARSAAASLDRRAAVVMCMVPEGPAHVIGWDLVRVCVLLARSNLDEDVVARRGWRDVQPVRVHVRAVKVAKLVVEGGGVVPLFRQGIDKRERQIITRLDADRRTGDVAIVHPGPLRHRRADVHILSVRERDVDDGCRARKDIWELKRTANGCRGGHGEANNGD